MTPAAPLPRPVTLRPVRADDSDAMQAFLAGLDATSRRLRFHAAVSAESPALLRHLTQADGVQHVAFVACTDDGSGAEALVGEARYFIDAHDGERAEFAIAVADSVRGSGVAAELLAAVMHSAQRAGVGCLHGDVMAGNPRMAGFMRRQGFEIDLDAEADVGVLRWQRQLVRPVPVPALRRDAWLLRGWWRRLGGRAAAAGVQ
jgi:acetyltransferase